MAWEDFVFQLSEMAKNNIFYCNHTPTIFFHIKLVSHLK